MKIHPNAKTLPWLAVLGGIVGLLVIFGPEPPDNSNLEAMEAQVAARREIARSYAERTRDWGRGQESLDLEECASAVTLALVGEISRSVTLEGASWDPTTGDMLVEATVMGADNIRGLGTMGKADETKLQTVREAMARCRSRPDVEVHVVYAGVNLATVRKDGVGYARLSDDERAAISAAR